MTIQHCDIGISLQSKFKRGCQAENTGTDHDDAAVFLHLVRGAYQLRLSSDSQFLML